MSLPYHNAITITEPARGKELMIALNDWVTSHALLAEMMPFSADIFVFVFPIYLVVVYLWGVLRRTLYYRKAALYIFFSALLAAVVNITIQYFGDKVRPEQAIENKDQLILSHLPTDPFPSDHAAVSAAVAMATLLWGLKHNDPIFKWLSLFFWTGCLVMSVSRVAVAIHRPTDILVGIGVGVVVSSFLLLPRVWKRVQRTLIPYILVADNIVFGRWLGIR